jgi:hypothetical protein
MSVPKVGKMPAQTSKKLVIGVSSPVGYFYARASEKGHPAPILESPLSYFLLYDELWFFSRQICPYNVEGLDFVHFVDEELQPKGLPKDAIAQNEKGPAGPFQWEAWNRVIEASIGRRWNYHNHAWPLQFGEGTLLPTPGHYENVLVDRFLAAEYKMDLVENTANAIWSKELDERSLQMTISEQLLGARVTSLQTIDGPWHPVIKDLRNDGLLKSYRQHIGNISEIENLSELDARVANLSNEFERVSAKIVAEHFETMSLGRSTILFLLGLIPTVGSIIAGSALLKEVADKLRARQENGWIGFLGKARGELKEHDTGKQT